MRNVYGTPSPRRSRSRSPTATAFRCPDSQQLEQRFILELQEHVKDKCCWTHCLDGLHVDFFLHENKVLRSDSDVVGVQVRRPKKTGTMGQLYSSAAFFSYPTMMYFGCTAGVASVFFALHHMWKAWCKQGKKKCWFMVCCRERPAWWGALVKVDIPFKYSAQVGRTTEWKEKRLHIWLSGRTTRQSCQSCLDSSRHFPSFVQISTPTLFTHRDFPFLFR